MKWNSLLAYSLLCTGLWLTTPSQSEAVLIQEYLKPDQDKHIYTETAQEGLQLQEGGWLGNGFIFQLKDVNDHKDPQQLIYRYYHPETDRHRLGLEKEAQHLEKEGWILEKPVGQSTPDGTAVYQMTSPDGLDIKYTTSLEEADTLMHKGWKQERTSWNATKNSPLPLETTKLSITPDRTQPSIAQQQAIAHELYTLESQHNYNLEHPLAVWNPFGTLDNALYFFVDESVQELTYTIYAKDYPPFKATAHLTHTPLGTIAIFIGFIPQQINYITADLKDHTGAESTYHYALSVPETYQYPVSLKLKTKQTQKGIPDQGIYILSTGNEGNTHTWLIDNRGIIRAELVTDDYRADNIIPYQHQLLYSYAEDSLVTFSPTTELTNIYHLEGYKMHHDYALSDDHNLYVLATNTDDHTIEDRIINLNLNTGAVHELVDMKNIFPEYVAHANTMSVYDLVSNQKAIPEFTSPDELDEIPEGWDWIHVNSIEVIDPDTVLLSARETSTIIKLKHLRTQPEIDYLIGEPDLWKETSYIQHFLTKQGDFQDTGGQHAVRMERDPRLPTHQYYIYFYNNNNWMHESNPAYSGHIPEDAGTFTTGSHSYATRYLIDEHNRAYQLDHRFKVPYSSIVSNTQKYNTNLIVNSGFNHPMIQEYTPMGELIQEFDYKQQIIDLNAFVGYRAIKSNLKGILFQ